MQIFFFLYFQLCGHWGKLTYGSDSQVPTYFWPYRVYSFSARDVISFIQQLWFVCFHSQRISKKMNIKTMQKWILMVNKHWELKAEWVRGCSDIYKKKHSLPSQPTYISFFHAYSTITCLLQCTAHQCKHMNHNLLMQYSIAASSCAPTFFFFCIAVRQREIEGPLWACTERLRNQLGHFL